MLRTFCAISLATLLYRVSAENIRSRFHDWVTQFNIDFLNTDHQETTYIKWADNDRYIENVNAQNLTYALAHNHFSGMDIDDFRDYIHSNGFYTPHTKPVGLRSRMHNPRSPPASIDWVANGAVTPVKNQGQCGSCWSFSTTGALEGAYYISHGTLESFSEQQLVDCDNLKNGGKDHGCNGGLMDNAFDWIGGNQGLCSESDYPYTSGTTTTAGSCQKQCSNVMSSGVIDYVNVSPSSDNEMMQAVAHQPVSVAIEADQKDFQLYSSGVFSGSCGTNLDHGVLVVGYGEMEGDDFYKVKNSWGTTWGSDGYIYLGRGDQYNNGDGQCGVLLQASYPIV